MKMCGEIVVQGIAGIEALVNAVDSGWTSVDDLLKTIGETRESVEDIWFKTEEVYEDRFNKLAIKDSGKLVKVGVVCKDKLYKKLVRIKNLQNDGVGFIDFTDMDYDTFNVKLKIRNEWLEPIHKAMKVYGTTDLQAFMNDWFGTWFDNNMCGACGKELEDELMNFAKYRKELKEENKAYKG